MLSDKSHRVCFNHINHQTDSHLFTRFSFCFDFFYHNIWQTFAHLEMEWKYKIHSEILMLRSWQLFICRNQETMWLWRLKLSWINKIVLFLKSTNGADDGKYSCKYYARFHAWKKTIQIAQITDICWWAKFVSDFYSWFYSAWHENGRFVIFAWKIVVMCIIWSIHWVLFTFISLKATQFPKVMPIKCHHRQEQDGNKQLLLVKKM